MIVLKIKNKNDDTKNVLSFAFQTAHNAIISNCEPITNSCTVYPSAGYEDCCATCPAKQGCRDIFRAYYHIKGEVE